MLGSAGCGEEGRECCVSERCATASLDAPAQPVVGNEELLSGFDSAQAIWYNERSHCSMSSHLVQQETAVFCN